MRPTAAPGPWPTQCTFTLIPGHCYCALALACTAATQVGLPFFSFILLGWLGLQQGLSAKLKEGERRKRYVEPEKPEDILAVRADRRETCAPGSRRPHGTAREYELA